MNAPASRDIETPCVKLCVVDPDSGYCIGCGRSRSEIAGWISMTPDERRGVMQQLGERMDSLTVNKRRQGGARARRSSQ